MHAAARWWSCLAVWPAVTGLRPRPARRTRSGYNHGGPGCRAKMGTKTQELRPLGFSLKGTVPEIESKRFQDGTQEI